uniref:Uncharacterized protein n=1 Tax=Triticum urartu TaxID=4572 RepID=A0A8R7UZT3_TRIUA
MKLDSETRTSRNSRLSACRRGQLVPELGDGGLDDGVGGHRGVDDGDPLRRVDLKQVELAPHQARRHEVAPFRRPALDPPGDHLRRRL